MYLFGAKLVQENFSDLLKDQKFPKWLCQFAWEKDIQELDHMTYHSIWLAFFCFR